MNNKKGVVAVVPNFRPLRQTETMTISITSNQLYYLEPGA